MARPIYSTKFIDEQGVAGPSTSVVVPTGRVYVVKFLSVYSHPTFGNMTVSFRSVGSGATIWFQRITLGSQDSRQLVEAHINFLPGDEFDFDVGGSFGDFCDVFAAGYDLQGP